MNLIHIVGGTPISGQVDVHGAKNAALPILTATAEISGVFTLRNCPQIRDIEITRQILALLGVETVRSGSDLLIDSRSRRCAAVANDLAAAIRSSSLFLGALSGAWGQAEVPYPGGCCLGLRPLDLHFDALTALGIRIDTGCGTIRCSGSPTGGTVLLRCPSVGATENLILAALGASGPVELIGAALEPEIVDLADFLRACGADITGDGTSRILIRPAPLHGTDYSILPDRMEAVTYLCAAACTGGSVTLTNVRPDTFRPVLELLAGAGCEITGGKDQLTLRAGRLKAVSPIVTGPYPAFPTDAQPLIMAVMTRAEGVTVLEETVFPERFRHVQALQAMGADIELAGSTAMIRGVERLRGADVQATDLRAAAALICAALAAEGESRIRNAWMLDRGYQSLPENLRRLGADINTEI